MLLYALFYISEKIHLITLLSATAIWLGNYRYHRVRASNHKNIIFEVLTFIEAKMINLFHPTIAKVIKTDAVLFFVYNILEFKFQCFKLCWIKDAFKHTILNPLPIIDALLCHLPQPFTSIRRHGFNIIRYQYHHSLFHYKNRIIIHIAPDITGHHLRLNIG